MTPLLKWPGGKAGEIERIAPYIPEHERYIEPFFGGGAVFFHLEPKTAVINDVSHSLMEYYSLVKAQDKKFHSLLMSFCDSFSKLYSTCSDDYDSLYKIYTDVKSGAIDLRGAEKRLYEFVRTIEAKSGFPDKILLIKNDFADHLVKMTVDKIKRTIKNEAAAPFSDEDLKENIITGFMSGYYMYFRQVFNDIQLARTQTPSIQYSAAVFYFIREYCYGSMFRYNANGEFNIPYGGMSYNAKNFKAKVENMFSDDVARGFSGTDIHCQDFEEFFESVKPNARDFIFLDPPYDTSFSNYEGRAFTHDDQERLAETLKRTEARFVLVIKNTDFIRSLYENEFEICSCDKKYMYNMRGRNEQKVEHLLITNTEGGKRVNRE